MDATAQNPNPNRSWGELGRTLLDRLHSGIRNLEQRLDQNMTRAGDLAIRKFLIEYDRNKYRGYTAYYDGVTKLGEAAVALTALGHLVGPSKLATSVLFDGAGLAISVQVGRLLLGGLAKNILASRHHTPDKAYRDPKKLPDLCHADYPAGQILAAKRCLDPVQQAITLFQIALQVPVMKDFDRQFGNEPPERRSNFAYLAMREHPQFRIVTDNLRERMKEAIESIHTAMRYLQGAPDSDPRRNLIREIQGHVTRLMPLGDIVNHKDTDRFYRQDLVDLAGRIGTLTTGISTPGVTAASQPTATSDVAPAPSARSRVRP